MTLRERWTWAALAVCWTSACAADDADDSGADTVADSSTSNGSEESSGADSSTGDAPIPSLLEQCEAPEPCDPYALDPGSNTEEVHPGLVCAVDQALDSIANGTAAELQSSFCDIGCSGEDVLLVGDGTAYIQTWTQTDATYYESIQRCSLKDASYFEPCAGPPPTDACSSWTAWVENCEPVETVTCPS